MTVSPRILIVDDDRISRLVLRRMVEVSGCSTEEADRGDQAQQRVLAGGIHLVLMDIHMPVMDGIQATQAIRKAGCTVPIVGVSAMDGGQIVSMTRQAGMNDVLLKPVRMQALTAVLERWLGDQQTHHPI